jgi:hypothetical protein
MSLLLLTLSKSKQYFFILQIIMPSIKSGPTHYASRCCLELWWLEIAQTHETSSPSPNPISATVGGMGMHAGDNGGVGADLARQHSVPCAHLGRGTRLNPKEKFED